MTSILSPRFGTDLLIGTHKDGHEVEFHPDELDQVPPHELLPWLASKLGHTREELAEQLEQLATLTRRGPKE